MFHDEAAPSGHNDDYKSHIYPLYMLLIINKLELGITSGLLNIFE